MVTDIFIPGKGNGMHVCVASNQLLSYTSFDSDFDYILLQLQADAIQMLQYIWL